MILQTNNRINKIKMMEIMITKIKIKIIMVEIMEVHHYNDNIIIIKFNLNLLFLLNIT
jgi:hypothetical protein